MRSFVRIDSYIHGKFVLADLSESKQQIVELETFCMLDESGGVYTNRYLYCV